MASRPTDEGIAAMNVPPSETDIFPDPEGPWEWAPDEGCRPATLFEADTRRCRRPRCRHRPVMAMLRGVGSKTHWWLYCADHMYGRRIADGVVEQRRRVFPEDEA